MGGGRGCPRFASAMSLSFPSSYLLSSSETCLLWQLIPLWFLHDMEHGTHTKTKKSEKFSNDCIHIYDSFASDKTS